ncbi:MAG: tripartite tricarboxylate transporter substrate-binding protein [Trueperaceae bacterium]
MATRASSSLMKRITLLVTATLLASLPATAVAQGDYPNQRLNWTIAFGPGGGNDIMSRTLIEILEKYDLYPNNIVAQNRAGGSGAVGWGYLFAQAGNPYHISSTSGSFITTPLQADTPWGTTSFTPIALLASDDMVILVNGDSEIDSLEDFIESARETPPSIGGIGAVNVDFIIPTLLADQAGFEFDYVSFNAAGELNTGLLSGSLDAIMSNPGEVLGLMESGDMKALAFSGVETPEALGDLPTFAEAGFPVDVSLPRGLILPPDVPQEAQQWWIDTMREVVETPEWQEYIDNNLLTENIRYGDEFTAFLQNTQDSFERILREQGAID